MHATSVFKVPYSRLIPADGPDLTLICPDGSPDLDSHGRSASIPKRLEDKHTLPRVFMSDNGAYHPPLRGGKAGPC